MDENDQISDYVIDFRELNRVGYIVKTENLDDNNPFDNGQRGYTISHNSLKKYIKIWDDSVITRGRSGTLKESFDKYSSLKTIFYSLYYNDILVHKSEMELNRRNKKIDKILDGE